MKNRPEVLSGRTIRKQTGCGNIYITLNRDKEGGLFEVKITMGKNGHCVNTMLHREAILWSYLCQVGATHNDLIGMIKKHYIGVTCNNSNKIDDKRCSSCGDVIGYTIMEEIELIEKDKSILEDKS